LATSKSCDETLDLTEGLFFKNSAQLFGLLGLALLENQFSDLLKQRANRLLDLSFEFLLTLQLDQPCQLSGRKFQKGLDLLINIRPIGCGPDA